MAEFEFDLTQIQLQFQSESTISQYLKASQDYLSTPKSRRLSFPFPNIQAQCPVCLRAECARWKGYYSRNMVCYEREFFGLVVIHCGQCRTEGVDFSYLPSFLIPYLTLSKASLQRLCGFYQGSKSVEEANASLCERSEEEQPLSTAYFRLYHVFVALSLNADNLGLHGSQHASVLRLREPEVTSNLEVLFCQALRWHPRSERARAPPKIQDL